MTFTAQQSRVDALVRLLGLIVLAFGLLMLYYTYANADAAGIAPEIITVNYSLGILLSVVGLFATFSKFK
ncbi:MAG: hypothetical protein JRN28_02770 [Nitrososphaerota archaeon]|nr:hypothetical protein [Nitrososphaerota archaeon]